MDMPKQAYCKCNKLYQSPELHCVHCGLAIEEHIVDSNKKVELPEEIETYGGYPQRLIMLSINKIIRYLKAKEER